MGVSVLMRHSFIIIILIDQQSWPRLSRRVGSISYLLLLDSVRRVPLKLRIGVLNDLVLYSLLILLQCCIGSLSVTVRLLDHK